MNDVVRIEIDPETGIGTIVLDQPDQRNPLSTNMMRQVTAALREMADDETVRAVVLSAVGPAFSAGHDLSEMIDRTLEDEREVFEVCTAMMDTCRRFRSR